MVNTIREYIRSLVPAPLFEAGEGLLEAGAVLDVHVQSKSVNARVANETGRFENVTLAFRKQQVSSRCTCRARVPICSHGAAVLLHVSDSQPDLFGFLGCAEALQDDAGGESGGVEALEQSVRKGGGGNGRRIREEYLVSLLDAGGRRNCSLILERVDGEQPLETRWQRLRLRAHLESGGKRYSAGNMKKMMDGTKAAGGMKLADFSPRDRQIIRFLSLHAEPQEGSLFEMDAIKAADFFHCLLGFEHFFVDGRQIHVHEGALVPRLVVGTDETGCSVAGSLELPNAGSLPAGRVVPIAGRGGVWVGVDGHYWWLPGIVDPGWLRFFVRGDRTEIGEEQVRELFAAAEAGRLRARVLYAQKNDMLRIEQPECVPVLLLDWAGDAVQATLEFDYGGVRMIERDGRTEGNGGGFVVRDPEAERAAVDFVVRSGFERTGGGDWALRNRQSIWRFVHRELARLGGFWRIFLTPEFIRKQEACHDLALDINTGQEGDGWFDLHCSAREKDGKALSWDVLAEACRNGEEYVSGADGVVLHIPDDVRRVVTVLLQQVEEQDGDSLSFDIRGAFSVGDAVANYLGAERVPSGQWQKLRQRLLAPDLESRVVELPEELQTRLRDYQLQGVRWLTLLEETDFHGILADEMGLGKTIQALAALVHRKMVNEKTRPSLVVCPTSLIENWVIEAKRFAPQLRTMAVRGLQRRHLIERLPELDLAVTSYALLRRDVKDYEALDLDYLILDEAQHIKNPGTANARTCKSLCARHRLILTGTPLENSTREMWSLFDFLQPGFLGTQAEFRKRFGATGEGAEEAGTMQELAARIRPFILRRTKDEVCRQLPPKIEQVVYCHLNAKQQKLHQNLIAAGREMVRIARREGWNTRRFQILSVIMRLRQLCCHPRLLPAELRTGDLADPPSAKTELLKEIIEEAIDGGHRILLFSQFTSFLKILQEWLRSAEIPYEYLDGSTPDRQARVDRFNADASIPIFLLSLKAGGTGLNMTGADTVIHYDLWWNPMVEDQATDRTHRIGQEKPVTVYKLVARHSIEEKIRQLQDKKRRMFNDLMAGAPARADQLSEEDFDFIFGGRGGGVTQ